MKSLLFILTLLLAGNYCSSQCVANFSVNTTDSCLNGNSFSFVNASTTSVGKLTYNWDFGDSNAIDTNTNPVHSYAKAGSYTVLLSIKYSNGCTTSTTKKVTVFPNPVVGPIMGDTILCINQVTHLSDTTPGGLFISPSSDFFLDNVGNAYTPFSGIYPFTYTVTNAFGCSGSSSVNLYVGLVTPLIHIVTDNNPLCPDSCATFSFTSNIYGAIKPALQWQLNGLNVGTGVSTYNYCGAKAGDNISCFLDTASSTNGCVTVQKAYSNVVTIQTITPPSITGDSLIYVGDSDTLHITSTGNFWHSSNPKIATIDSNGIMTAHSAGVVTITDTATYPCGKSLETFNVIVDNPIPVSIKNYELQITKEKKVVNIWQTATELNTSHFIIQHSTNGTSFTDIGTVKAIGSGANKYAFTDSKPNNGINYYRLKSVDKDGATTYSKVVSVQFTVNSNQLTVYPNPAKSSVSINGSHISSVQVIDNIGRVVKVVSLKDATNPTLSVSGLPAGVYHLRVQTTDGVVSGTSLVVSY